jgi:hypothetical protein
MSVTVVTRGIDTPKFAPSEYSAQALESGGATMRPITTMPDHSRLDGIPDAFEARGRGEREAHTWLVRQLGWEYRLAGLHALAGVQPSARCLDAQRAVERCSGVLELPRYSAGVCA